MFFGIAFAFTWVAFLVGPILGAVVILRIRDNISLISLTVIYSSTFIFAVVLAIKIGFQTSSILINFSVCLFAFLAYCILASTFWTLPTSIARIVAGSIAYAAFVPTYFLGTVGVVVLLFIAGDFLSPPTHVEIVRPGLSCRIMGWGAAFSDEGYDVHLYSYLPWFPLFRLQVAKVTVDETNPGSGPKQATCLSAAKSIGA